MSIVKEDINLERIISVIENINSLKAAKEKYSITSDFFWISRNFSLKYRQPVQWAIKRIFDLVVSIIGIITLFPLLLLVALIIKLESEGPVIYKQKRLGLYGRPFDMYKFRSMKVKSEKEEDEVKKIFNQENEIMFKIPDDPRVTNVGRIIRKFSIDEFPQLINVIKGEMSLVGPRPRVAKDLTHFSKWHYLFFGTVPGITGVWQVNGRSKIKDFNQVAKMEYDYICNWNVFLDLYILLKTIPVVVLAKNTA